MVCLSVSLLVMFVNLAVMAEPIEMLFGWVTWVGQRNNVLDEVQCGRGNVWGCLAYWKAWWVTAVVYAAKISKNSTQL